MDIKGGNGCFNEYFKFSGRFNPPARVIFTPLLAVFSNSPETEIQQIDCLETQMRLYPRLFPAPTWRNWQTR